MSIRMTVFLSPQTTVWSRICTDICMLFRMDFRTDNHMAFCLYDSTTVHTDGRAVFRMAYFDMSELQGTRTPELRGISWAEVTLTNPKLNKKL